MSTSAAKRDTPPTERRDRFERLYREYYAMILAYALRRTSYQDEAHDVVAETFLTLWRRLDQAPEGPSARLWLYGVARRILSNHERSGRRRDRLAARLASQAVDLVAAPADADVPDGVVALAWDRLSPKDRDLLLLVAVEGLRPAEIAQVVGASTATVRVRLHRARARFARELRSVGVDV